MSTLASNQKQPRIDKQTEAAAADILHICGFTWTRFNPVEWMTPLYIDDPKWF